MEKDLALHYKVLKQFLDISDDLSTRQKLNSTRAARAREKLLRLSPAQFKELSTDVYDELRRRIDESRGELDYLLPKSTFHPKRNQARQKLASLPQSRFKDLVADISYEIERRGFHEYTPSISSSNGIKHGSYASKISGNSLADAFDRNEREKERGKERSLEKERERERDLEEKRDREREEQKERERKEDEYIQERELKQKQERELQEQEDREREEEDRQLQEKEDREREQEERKIKEQEERKLKEEESDLQLLKQKELEKSQFNTDYQDRSVGIQSKTLVPTKANLAWSSDEEDDDIDNQAFQDLQKLNQDLELKNLELQKQLDLEKSKNEKAVLLNNEIDELKQTNSLLRLQIQSLKSEKQMDRDLDTKQQTKEIPKSAETQYSSSLISNNPPSSISSRSIVDTTSGLPINENKSAPSNQKLDEFLLKISDLSSPIKNQTIEEDDLWQSRFEQLKSQQIVESFDNGLVSTDLSQFVSKTGLISLKLVADFQSLIESFIISLNSTSSNLDSLFEKVLKVSLSANEIANQAESNQLNSNDYAIALREAINYVLVTTRYFATYNTLLPKIVVERSVFQLCFILCDLISVSKLNENSINSRNVNIQPEQKLTNSTFGVRPLKIANKLRENLNDVNTPLADNAPREIKIQPKLRAVDLSKSSSEDIYNESPLKSKDIKASHDELKYKKTDNNGNKDSNDQDSSDQQEDQPKEAIGFFSKLSSKLAFVPARSNSRKEASDVDLRSIKSDNSNFNNTSKDSATLESSDSPASFTTPTATRSLNVDNLNEKMNERSSPQAKKLGAIASRIENTKLENKSTDSFTDSPSSQGGIKSLVSKWSSSTESSPVKSSPVRVTGGTSILDKMRKFDNKDEDDLNNDLNASPYPVSSKKVEFNDDVKSFEQENLSRSSSSSNHDSTDSINTISQHELPRSNLGNNLKNKLFKERAAFEDNKTEIKTDPNVSKSKLNDSYSDYDDSLDNSADLSQPILGQPIVVAVSPKDSSTKLLPNFVSQSDLSRHINSESRPIDNIQQSPLVNSQSKSVEVASDHDEDEYEDVSEGEYESEEDSEYEEHRKRQDQRKSMAAAAFNVDLFDIDDPDNSLTQVLLYLEHQTVEVISTIQSLLIAIKKPNATQSELREKSRAIAVVISQMNEATNTSMNQSRNAQLKEHGSWVVKSLEDCDHRMTALCKPTSDDDEEAYADKSFRQRLAGISFDIAKCTKELVKTVEEASLQEDIEYLDGRLNRGV